MVSRKISEQKEDQKNTTYEHFPKLPHVWQLIWIFENLQNDTRVSEVWFLKKNDKGDGFEEFHYDYKNSGGGSNYISSTVNLNLGKLNEDNDIATKKISPSNEELSILSKTKEIGDDAETISTRKRRDQLTT